MVDPDWIFDQQILKIFEKPGHLWNAAEQELVIEWIFDSRRLKLLLTSILNRFLAFRFSLDDVEDAWSDFCVRDIYSVIKTFDPARPNAVPFPQWLKFCFSRSCARRI